MDDTQTDTKLTISEVYAEVGTNYRYFLSWRHRLFAGYFAIIAALAIALSWVVKNEPSASWVPFAAGLIVTVLYLGS